MKTHIISGCLLALSCAPAAPGRTIYGVKSAPGDPSQVPGYLFACREDGTEAHTVGLLRVGAALVDVDGLALDAGDRLYGFECLPAGARLLEIDPTTGSGVRIGPLAAAQLERFEHPLMAAILVATTAVLYASAAMLSILRPSQSLAG